MNRSIKFRAWQKYHQKMLKVNGIEWSKSEEIKTVTVEYSIKTIPRTITYGLSDWSIDCLEIMQYIGLKDKNGIEIYEGDIVDTHDDEYNSSKLKIESRKGNSVACDDNIGYEEPISNHHYKDWEVIGNIHENADLLND